MTEQQSKVGVCTAAAWPGIVDGSGVTAGAAISWPGILDATIEWSIAGSAVVLTGIVYRSASQWL